MLVYIVVMKEFMCVCMWGHWPANWFDSLLRHFGVVVSLSKKTLLTLLQFTQLLNGDWGNGSPSCSINGYLVVTGEANVKPCLLMGVVQVGLQLPTGYPSLTCEVLALWISQLWLIAPQGTPVSHWVSVTILTLPHIKATEFWFTGQQ